MSNSGIFHKEVLNFMWDLKFHVRLVIFIYFFNCNLTSATFGGSTLWVQPASFHRWHTSKWLMNALRWWFATTAFCEIASMGKCLFDDNWLEDEKYRGCLKKTASNHEARCALCKKTIKLGTMGHIALDSHMKAEKHKKYVSSQASSLPISMFSSSTSTSQPSSRPSTSSNAFGSFANVAALKAEILWVFQTVSRHHSYTSNEDIHLVFQAMFPAWTFSSNVPSLLTKCQQRRWRIQEMHHSTPSLRQERILLSVPNSTSLCS